MRTVQSFSMRVQALICEGGCYEVPAFHGALGCGERTFAELYKLIPDQYRYAIGEFTIGRKEFVVWDIYASPVFAREPYVSPHFVEDFTDYDQAVAALQINYDRNVSIAGATREDRHRHRMVVKDFTKWDGP